MMHLRQTLQRLDRFVFGGGSDTPARMRAGEPSAWEAQGDRFQSLEQVADAYNQGRFHLPPGESLRVHEKAWQPDKADETRRWGKTALVTSAALLGAGLAGVAIVPVLGLGLVMTGMIAGATGLGFAEVAHDFDRAPQIRELGWLSGTPDGAVYENLDTGGTRAFPRAPA